MFGNQTLIWVYSTLKQPMIFVWLCIIGMIATLTTRTGFIDVQGLTRKKIMIGSGLLLLATGGIFVLSMSVKTVSSLLASSGGCILFVLIRKQI